MHHLVFIHRHDDGTECIGFTDLLDLRGVVSYWHSSLPDVVELQSELQLTGCGVGGEDPLQIPLGIIRRLCIPYVPEHLIVNT